MTAANSNLPYLTDKEIADICEPLINGAAQYRYLKKLGLYVVKKPNGKPLVARSEFERVIGAGRMAIVNSNTSGVNLEGIRAKWASRSQNKKTNKT